MCFWCDNAGRVHEIGKLKASSRATLSVLAQHNSLVAANASLQLDERLPCYAVLLPRRPLRRHRPGTCSATAARQAEAETHHTE